MERHLRDLITEPRTCRICGCTDYDCSGCIDRTGEPCHWVEADRCSACEPGAVVLPAGTYLNPDEVAEFRRDWLLP